MPRFPDMSRTFGSAPRDPGVDMSDKRFPGVHSAVDRGFPNVEIERRTSFDGQVAAVRAPDLVHWVSQVAIEQMTLDSIRAIELADAASESARV